VCFGFSLRRLKTGVAVGDWRSLPCGQLADMGAEAVVVGRVENGGGQWAAQAELVVGSKQPTNTAAWSSTGVNGGYRRTAGTVPSASSARAAGMFTCVLVA